MGFENILCKLIEEIRFELNLRNVHIEESFVRYYVRLLAIDPVWELDRHVLINRPKIEEFIAFVTEKLCFHLDPDITTLKMQVYFTDTVLERQDMIGKLRAEASAKLKPLERDILTMTTIGTSTPRHMRKFYKKLIYYVALRSGLDNPTNETVYEEVRAALRSVLTDQDLKDFVHRPVDNKIDNLKDFTEIVAGIRLFYKFCCKRGREIEDIPKMIIKATEVMQKEVKRKLSHIMQKVNILTTSLELHYETKKINTDAYGISLKDLPENVTEQDIERVKKLLIMHRQYEVFMRKLTVLIDKVTKSQEELSDKFRRLYRKISEVVDFKSAAAASHLFPKFMEMAKVWFRIQNEAMLLKVYDDVMSTLTIFIEESSTAEDDLLLDQLLGQNEPRTDTERMREQPQTSLVACKDSTFKLLQNVALEDLTKYNFEFLGFCVWTLVASNGAFIPGNPSVGVVENRGKYFIFSDPIALNMFNRNPKNTINRALSMFRKNPEMINFFGVFNVMQEIRNVKELFIPDIVGPEMISIECQTVIHPVPENKVANYKWNIWDLKREALQLSYLSRCKTTSCQTEECAGVSPVKTQTYDTKEQYIQTMSDKATKIPKPKQFLYGLRGRQDDKQIQLDITEQI